MEGWLQLEVTEKYRRDTFLICLIRLLRVLMLILQRSRIRKVTRLHPKITPSTLMLQRVFNTHGVGRSTFKRALIFRWEKHLQRLTEEIEARPPMNTAK